jgi:hypothetical protein
MREILTNAITNWPAISAITMSTGRGGQLARDSAVVIPDVAIISPNNYLATWNGGSSAIVTVLFSDRIWPTPAVVVPGQAIPLLPCPAGSAVMRPALPE